MMMLRHFEKSLYANLTVLFLSILSQITRYGIAHGEQSGSSQLDANKIISFYIDYKESCSELCLIGAKYDTDKSSQRHNVTDRRHCHPYTLFYDSVFKDKRDAELAIAELGILYGASLLMWRDYFKNAKIYGFENNIDLIDSFQSKFSDDRITLAQIDVRDSASIKATLQSAGLQYDLIIDDTTHRMEDQVRIVENVYPYLKEGGMLILEDVFKKFKEKDYIDRLKPILSEFQDCYFVTMEHKNRCSTYFDNDKILVLVKGGGKAIFRNEKKMTIINFDANLGEQELQRVRKVVIVKEINTFGFLEKELILGIT